MQDPVSFDGWAFSWYQHSEDGSVNPYISDPVHHPPDYTKDFGKTMDLMYNEKIQYCFHFRVTRRNPHTTPFIKAETNLKQGLILNEPGPVFLSSSFESGKERVDPRAPGQAFLPSADNENAFWIRLFWPRRRPEWHEKGLYTFIITLGWITGYETTPVWSDNAQGTITVRITAVLS